MKVKPSGLRGEKGYSCEYVSDYLGIARRSYMLKEKGEHEFKWNELLKLSELYGVSLADMKHPNEE